MQHDHVQKKVNFDQLTPSPGSGEGDLGVGVSAGKYLVPFCCNHDSLKFDMQHDHVLKS